jgi:DNA-binding protein WhiA
MLRAGEVKGELARIHPARSCCRRAELAGLLLSTGPDAELRTLDHAIARTAVHLSTSLGSPVDAPRAVAADRAQPPGTRHHLVVRLDPDAIRGWSWQSSAACDRRAFMRGTLLAAGSLSFGRHGAHLEFVFRGRPAADTLARRLRELDVQARRAERRGRHLVYLKGQDEIASVLRLAGANRGLLELETGRVGREVRSRLNRLVNAEQANLGRTVRAADHQLQAIDRIAAAGLLERQTEGIRDAARARRQHPDADLDTLAAALGISRSATNHRLRRLVELADDLD